MSSDEVAYESVRQVLPHAAVVLQDNPGPMTLEGTNTWLLRGSDASSCVVVDPGEDRSDTHLSALLEAAGSVELVLVTHGHHDHSGLAAAVHDATGAPVRAVDPQYCHGATVLDDGEVLAPAGLRLRVLHTPGHTADSASFVLLQGESPSAVLSGDSILGRGTAVVAHPDGVLGPYLSSLSVLRDLGGIPVLPGHGPSLPSAQDVASYYLTHRAERLTQVRDALAHLGDDATARQIVEHVYADVDQNVWWAAELSVKAQLDYLRETA